MSDVDKGGFVDKVIGPKRRWREYKARVKRMPEPYRDVVDAIERYLMHFVPSDGDRAESMFEDLADLFDQAAADGTPIREVVGENPMEFIETFVQNYTEGGYVPARARKQLTDAITRAEEEQTR
ncbi:DNA-binding ferritin-like protein (Dps family) [Actinocrispum wychmicini]|uniref:DNA-binding ferritin-like protein (Dps family) n=2 Tax=Actinocrispum wychmicini TaxID=1213861 RepID=A0A4R2JCC0_9PSEU|nr:DNA-binding ferritin-like protein (Dps family) [Actinocrispum wychmicini]